MGITVVFGAFEWDQEKEAENIRKHGVDFDTAVLSFIDPLRIIAIDEAHSDKEPRHFCIGKVAGKVLTVRFTKRGARVRIFGAGYWRKGRSLYVKENG